MCERRKQLYGKYQQAHETGHEGPATSTGSRHCHRRPHGEASSGGGAVKVVATCKGQLKSIKIDPEAADPEDIESLEDMVMLAVNNAMEEGQKIQTEEMAKVTAGFNMPGLG